MASGVVVADACKSTFEEIKREKKHRYVIFHIRDESEIDVDLVGDRDANYDQFLTDLQSAGPEVSCITIFICYGLLKVLRL